MPFFDAVIGDLSAGTKMYEITDSNTTLAYEVHMVFNR
jgi:hypothetical protein